MALGCPVIVSDRGALPEIVGGHGHMVRIDDYESAADYVRRLLIEPSWAVMERNKIMGYAASLTWERTVGEIVELYRSTVDRVTRNIGKKNLLFNTLRGE
jgi:glycosyltransferase involved in cell wall biosynthesis